TEVADYLFPPKRAKVEPRKWMVKPEDMTISYSSAYIVDGAMRLASTGAKSRNASWPTKFEAPEAGTYKISLALSSKNAPAKSEPVFLLRSTEAGRGSQEKELERFKVKSSKPEVFSVEAKLNRGENFVFYYANSPYNFGDKAKFSKFLKGLFLKEPKLAAAWSALGKVPRGGIGWQRLKKEMAKPDFKVGKFANPKEIDKLVSGLMKKGSVNTGETLVYKFFEEGPNIGIHDVKIEGPFNTFEDPSDLNRRKVAEKFLGKYSKPENDESLKVFLQNYLTAVFKRPATKSEVSQYFDLAKKGMAGNRSFEDGLHLVVRTSLVSPDFIYREKGSGKFTQHELATRLSYFLTSSAPDSEIIEKVQKGILHNGGTLRYQASRLIDSWASKAFVRDFTSQWLDTKLLSTLMPDPKLFKKFNSRHRANMISEVEMTFEEILKKNLPLKEFIDPDFVYTDASIGKTIYELKQFKNDKIGKVKKVKIPRGTRQGGILSMPAVMMATANGVDTQPVLRGVWILENVLGTPVPEPPKNVPAITPDTTGTVGPREKLLAHMKSPSCSSCHVDIDPMGFVLENFDAVGRWRTHYMGKTKKKKGLKIDPSATMPNGTKLNDVRDLKRFLVENPAFFTNCLAEKLMTYATGRVLNYKEKKIIKEIVAKNISSGNKFKDLLIDLIDSPVFRYR
ncbi:MAG: DUF1588 domain-containing protein, partial [Lentisphaeraceae bacterium]|nr:DUF1588 domain-containing protein [Lentisphaeraceae bacterium]